MPPSRGDAVRTHGASPEWGEKGAGQGCTGRGRAMEEGMDRRTDHVPVGARQAAGVPAPPARHIPGGPWGGLPLQREEASSLLPSPRKSGFEFSQPPKPSAPGARARGQAAQTPSSGGGGSGPGPPTFLPSLSSSSSSSLPALPLLSCWAQAPCCSRSCPSSPPAVEGGGQGGVTSSPNRRFPPALGTASGASQPSPGLLLLLLLLLLPPQTPNKHGTGEVLSILPASPGETEAPPHMGAPPATRSQRGRAGGEHVGPRPASHRCPVPPLSCFSPFPSPPAHRPAEGSDPSAIDGPLLPCHCTLPGTALPRDASVALKATSSQRLAPGIFPSPGVEGAPCPPPLLRTQGCSVPQFPWLGEA